MKNYLLLIPDEDGNPIRLLGDEEIKDISQLKEEFGIKEFLDDWPETIDPNYWGDGVAMLLKVKVLKVKPKKVVEKWTIEDEE